MAKTASRIALYMMREEMTANPVESSPVQHSHDFFVISSCAVFGKLRGGQEEGQEDDEVNLHGVRVRRNQLPGDYEANRTVFAR